MRTRSPARRTLPSRTCVTPKRFPTSRTSTGLPLYVKVELRAITSRPESLDRSVMMSSVMPSLKYSCSASPLMFWNGGTARDEDSAGVADALQAGSDVDAVAVEILAFDDHVAEIDADAQHDAAVVGLAGRALGHRRLHADRALHGVDDAGEFGEQAVPGGLEDTSPTVAYRRIDELGAQALQPRQRAFLVDAHEAAEADDIDCQY